jgi:hypothetical protein
MAVYESFRCNDCDHEVYGFEGDSATMSLWLRAVVCASCQEVTILDLGQTHDGQGRTLPKQPPKEVRCRSCRSRRVKTWHAENGCPKCGRTMEPDPFGPSIAAD